MAARALPALNRLKGWSVVFNGKFSPGQRERLAGMIAAQGGAVAKEVSAKVTHLVLADKAAGAPLRKKAAALNAKGASIEVLQVEAFLTLARPTQDELVALLKQGAKGAKLLAEVAPPIDTHNHHGASPDCQRLVEAKLDGFDLSGLDLDGIAFEKCSFVGANLDQTQFIETIACDFSQAVGQETQFIKCNCSQFTNSRLEKALFCSHLQGCDFTGAHLDGSKFTESFWGSGVVKRPSKKGPNFTRASLCECLFELVLLDGVDFSEASLMGTAFRYGRLHGANLRKADARGALLVACELNKADLTGASFLGANLAEAKLTDAKLAGADFTAANLRGAIVKATALRGMKGVTAESTQVGAVGPALKELDALFLKGEKVVIGFHVGKPEEEGHELQITVYCRPTRTSAFLYLPDLSRKIQPAPLEAGDFSQEILQAGRVFGHLPVRFETLVIKNTKCPISTKALRELVMRGIAEAFAQPLPGELDAEAAEEFRAKQREVAAAKRQAIADAQAAKAKEQSKATKQIAKRVAKAVGQVSDVASFLKALEFRFEKPKIDKATKMLKASRFKLFSDVTDQHVSGVVKSQADADLVYACRLEDSGKYSCCTQNLNICGGLRGSICKHLLVLIIGLVHSGELDPAKIDDWIAKTHGAKPELDRENLGEIFLKYKGADAGEIDWRPTETLPEDYYAF